jgi:hypothetical protein
MDEGIKRRGPKREEMKGKVCGPTSGDAIQDYETDRFSGHRKDFKT